MKTTWIVLVAAVCAFSVARGADSLDVTFRYSAPPGSPLRVFLPGEFNSWGSAVDGRIDPGSPALMEYIAGRRLLGTKRSGWRSARATPTNSTCTTIRTVRRYDWIPDPLNPLTDGSQFGNSVVAVTSPMIFEPEAVRGTGGAITKILAGVFARPSVSRVTLVIGGDSVDVTASRDPADRDPDVRSPAADPLDGRRGTGREGSPRRGRHLPVPHRRAGEEEAGRHTPLPREPEPGSLLPGRGPGFVQGIAQNIAQTPQGEHPAPFLGDARPRPPSGSEIPRC